MYYRYFGKGNKDPTHAKWTAMPERYHVKAFANIMCEKIKIILLKGGKIYEKF